MFTPITPEDPKVLVSLHSNLQMMLAMPFNSSMVMTGMVVPSRSEKIGMPEAVQAWAALHHVEVTEVASACEAAPELAMAVEASVVVAEALAAAAAATVVVAMEEAVVMLVVAEAAPMEVEAVEAVPKSRLRPTHSPTLPLQEERRARSSMCET
jgi:hypothetical protein